MIRAGSIYASANWHNRSYSWRKYQMLWVIWNYLFAPLWGASKNEWNYTYRSLISGRKETVGECFCRADEFFWVVNFLGDSHSCSCYKTVTAVSSYRPLRRTPFKTISLSHACFFDVDSHNVVHVILLNMGYPIMTDLVWALLYSI